MSNYNQLIITYENGLQDVITLNDSIISFGQYQFMNIAAVEVPEIVEVIADYAFCDNHNLSAITLSEGLEMIGNQAFQHGVYSSVTIPSTVEEIGLNAFNIREEQGMGQAGDLYITCLATTPPMLDDMEGITFGDPNYLQAIYVPAGSVSAYQSAWPDYATKIQANPTPPPPTPTTGFSTLDIVSAYVGTEIVERLYLGDELVWGDEPGPVEDPMLRTPLTIEITDTGGLGSLGIRLSGVTSTTQRDEYRKPVEYVLTRNGVETTGYFELNSAVSSGAVTSTISVQNGDKIELYAKNANQGGFSSTNTIFQYFVTSSGLKANVYGNINSLLVTKTEFDTNGAESLVLSTCTFFKTFLNKDGFSFGAPADYYHILLPSTTLAERCYDSLFMGCSGLTAAPKLPATTLAPYCYGHMFHACSALTAAPELPATTMQNNCYHYMFYECVSLTTAPELPATTLAEYCYQYMFTYCRSLTTAPELPATTLASYCYQNMFQNCTSLTTAPELPATNFASREGRYYFSMFGGCSSLNYVKCMVLNPTSGSQSRNPTFGWLSNVASTGTFVRPAGVTTWDSGGSGIPTNWTVVDA